MESLETENPTNFLSLNQDANRPSTDTTALPTSKGRKHVRLTVDEDYIERISSDSELQSPKCSNHLLSFLESSHNWSIQTTPSLFNRQQKKLRKTIISKTLISRIAPILRCLQWLSLLPFVWNETACTRRQIFWKKILFWSMFALSFSLNLFLLVINLLIVVRLREMCNSVIHWRILTAVVTGMKPTINCVSFLSFAVLLKEHKTLLRKMMEADNGFYDLFQRSPPIEKYVRIFFVAATTSFVAPMVLRLMEYVAHGEVLGNSILSDASIFIVPLLSVWNCAPFLYFFVICAMLRFWFHSLAEEIRNDPFLKRRNLRFYYLHFSKLARVMDSVGQVFNPFVFFSVAWSMLTLCLTIYFLVKSGHIFNAMENDGIDIFNLSYCGIQISIAMVYLILIIVYGIQTNETARFVCIHLFALKSRELDAQDRFQLFSVVFTYAFLLLKIERGQIVKEQCG